MGTGNTDWEHVMSYVYVVLIIVWGFLGETVTESF